MDMNKTNSSIDENEESLVGEVLSDDEVREKKQAIAKWQHSPVGFGSYITKSNDLIQRTKYSLPRNEQKVLFMLMSKIDQKNDKDASKYYSITFNDFAKLTGVRTVDTTYALNLKETIENLENRTFWVKKEPGSKVYRSISWLQKGSEVDFDKKEIRLRFNQDIWKDIAQLTSNYTSYSIEYLLMMKSTYSMRVYEIILSYDNGNRDYGYTNGLVFQPVNDEILNKFSSKRDELTGYKYKKFNIDEFKGLLSAPTEAERESTKSKKKKDPASADKKKFDREKPLSEKYKTFTEFEKNVLKTVKKEINEMTDLWFDYAPARKRGVRKYEYLYIFIKYKTKAEMRDVRSYHDRNTHDDEIVRESRKKKTQSAEKAARHITEPFSTDILKMKYRKATTEIRNKADYASYEDKLTDNEKNICNDIFTYTAKILTNTNKGDQAEETLDSLNRIIHDNAGLKTWALGLCVKFTEMFEKATERKSAQYYRTVVYNDTIENSALIIAAGKQKLASLDPAGVFKFDMSVFEDV